MGLLAVMEPAQSREIVQPRRPALGKRNDVIDLESGAQVTPGHDAGRISRFERRPEMRRDRAAGVRHTRHLDAVPLEDLHEPISRHPTGNRHGNRADAADDTPLSGFDASSFERCAIDFDVNHGTRNLGAGGEPQQRVGRIGVARLALSGAARLDLQALGASLDGRDQLRPVVGREAPVQSNRTVWIGPMTKIPAPADALTSVLV